MKLDADFVESRMLPLVMAFGAGVVIATLAAEPREVTTITGNDLLLIGIECVPAVEGAPVWVAGRDKP